MRDILYAKFQVLTPVLLKTQVFWDVMACHCVVTNILKALQSFKMLAASCRMTHPHIPGDLNLQIRSLFLVEARSSIYVAAVLIMKYQLMYSTSQIKVHLMSCTDTVLCLTQQAITNVQAHDK